MILICLDGADFELSQKWTTFLKDSHPLGSDIDPIQSANIWTYIFSGVNLETREWYIRDEKGKKRLRHRGDLDFPMIWDLKENSQIFNAGFVYPPFHFNANIGDFRYLPADLGTKKHEWDYSVRETLKISKRLNGGFNCTSFFVLDRVCHIDPGQAEFYYKWVDDSVKELCELHEKWAIISDHGFDLNTKHHRKPALIMSNLNDVPNKTSEVFEWLLTI